MSVGETCRGLLWLRDSLSALDRVYFSDQLAHDKVTVKWYRWRPTECFVFGDYLEGQIRINRALAWLWVPDYVVLANLFHEALHHVIGMDHDTAFKLAERTYVHHAEALVWESQNMVRLTKAKRPF